MRVGPHRGRSIRDQHLDKLPDEGRAMPAIEHVGLADILVDSTRAFGQMSKWVRFPPMHVIILRESEWPAVTLDDPHRDPRVNQLVRFGFDRGIAPPLADVRLCPPPRDERQIVPCQRAKSIIQHGA